jgi:hypothetical protein
MMKVDSFRYHHALALNVLCAWPMDFTLFQFPIRTDGKFIDQCARGLSILGLPNFYFQDQSQLVESKTLAVINGSKFCDIEGQIPGASRSFFKDKHIQCLISWLFKVIFQGRTYPMSY